MGRLLNITESSRVLGVTTQTLRTWINKGYIKAKTIGDSRFIDEGTLLALQDTAEDAERALLALQKERDKDSAEAASKRNKREEGRITRRYYTLCMEASYQGQFFESVISLMNAFNVLNQREADILISKLKGKSFYDICEEYNISSERIRQIATRAIRKSCELEGIAERFMKAEGLEEENRELRATIEILKARLEEKGCLLSEEEKKRRSDVKKLYSIMKTELSDCDLSVRSLNVLMNPVSEGKPIRTVGELCEMDALDILRRKNAGKKVLNELSAFLESLGIGFGMDVDGIYLAYSVINEQEKKYAKYKTFYITSVKEFGR